MEISGILSAIVIWLVIGIAGLGVAAVTRTRRRRSLVGTRH